MLRGEHDRPRDAGHFVGNRHGNELGRLLGQQPHGAPCISRQFVTKALGRSVSAVRGRKGVIDPDVAQLGERGDERRIVFLFAGVEAGVLETKDVAGLHRGDRALRRFADAVVGKFHRPLDDTSNFGGDRLQRLLWVAPLRPAEMRKQNDLAALVGDFSDRRCGALNAGRVGDDTILYRHVEIDAYQDALALQIDSIESAEFVHRGAHSSWPGLSPAIHVLAKRTIVRRGYLAQRRM